MYFEIKTFYPIKNESTKIMIVFYIDVKHYLCSHPMSLPFLYMKMIHRTLYYFSRKQIQEEIISFYIYTKYMIPCHEIITLKRKSKTDITRTWPSVWVKFVTIPTAACVGAYMVVAKMTASPIFYITLIQVW